MFAVPGWSLSADKLKSETTITTTDPATTTTISQPTSNARATGANATQHKKRKRAGADAVPAQSGPQVTVDNVADLWERVIEKKEKQGRPDPKGRKNKKSKGKEGKDNGEGKDGKKKNSRDQQMQSKQPMTAIANEGDASDGQAAKRQRLETNTNRDGRIKKHEKHAIERPDAKHGPTATAKESIKKDMVQNTVQQETSASGRINKKSGKAKDKDHNDGSGTVVSPAKTAPVLPPPPSLTPLQTAMRAKLVSARFRHLNETLYTTPSSEALRLFGDAPDMFHTYHEGFRQQVAVWPENPVDSYIAEVKRRAGGGSLGGSGRSSKKPHNGRGGGRGGQPGTLPRTSGTCRIADVGCGDARLAATLAPDAARLRVQVLSYDLHADPRTTPHITAAADAADLPLESGSVDVVVFCLALMGTNWLTFVEEAYRVLRWKGELWVAEIKSRFAGTAELRARQKHKQALKGPVVHSVGYRRKMGGGKKGKDGGKEAVEDPDMVAAATAEVDGSAEGGGDSGGATTDVSAFVRSLYRRGFVLDENEQELAGGADGTDNAAAKLKQNGRPFSGKPPAVDLTNKMFVKMRFVKAAPASVGKDEVMRQMEASGNGSKKKSLKFIDDNSTGADHSVDPMDDPALEAKILKPCVYKLR